MGRGQKKADIEIERAVSGKVGVPRHVKNRWKTEYDEHRVDRPDVQRVNVHE